MGRWSCTSSGTGSRWSATRPASRSSTAGSPGRPWSKRHSPEAKLASGATAQLEECKEQPRERNDDGPRKRADRKRLVAAAASTARLGLENVGDEQQGGSDSGPVEKGRPPRPATSTTDEERDPNGQPG